MKAAGYIRVSTDEQVKEGVSLGNQEQKVRLVFMRFFVILSEKVFSRFIL